MLSIDLQKQIKTHVIDFHPSPALDIKSLIFLSGFFFFNPSST